MFLGEVLQAEADAALGPKSDSIIKAFGDKAVQEVRSGRFHITYISEPVANDVVAGQALAADIKSKLEAQRIPDCQCHVEAFKWEYTIDPGFQAYCLNENATHGFVVRIDYWARGGKPSKLPEIQGKLLTPDGYQSHVRASAKGIYSLWDDDDGDWEERDRQQREYDLLPILGAVNATDHRPLLHVLVEKVTQQQRIGRQEMDLSTSTAHAFAEYFRERWTSHRCCYRGTTRKPVPEIQITKMELLCNPSHAAAYFSNRTMLSIRNTPKEIEMPEKCKAMRLDSDAEEYLLFHGLPIDVLDAVLQEGFKIVPAADAANGRMFGDDSYFADMASKADLYAGMCGKPHVKVQLLCRVSLGKFHFATGETTRRECPRPGYDSVVALPYSDGGKVELHEMIVYNFLQALPVCAIWYSHKAACRCRFCDYCGGCS